MIALYRQGLALKAAATFHARSRKDEVLDATSDADVWAINLESGW